jgi:hypothetical protein
MFKSIISKFQDFGKAVVTKIVGFIGGVFGIKPQIVEIPAPPEISDVQANNSPEVSEPKEGLIKKACTTVKKAASAAIKTAQTILKVMAQTTYVVVRYGTPIIAYSAAWNYVQAQGITAIFMGLWNMGTLPYFILCMAIVIGIFATMTIAEMLWSALLNPIRRFLFRPAQKTQPAKQPVEQKKESITTNEAITIISTVVAQQFSQEIKSVSDRLTNLEAIATPEAIVAPAAIAIPTPVTTTEIEVVVPTAVDSSPAAITTPTSVTTTETEVVTVEIKEVLEVVEKAVDSSPAIDHPLTKLFVLDEEKLIEELAKTNMEDLKKIIAFLNSHVKAPKKIGSHVPQKTPKGEGKNILISRIKRQIQEIRAKNQVVTA